MRRNRNLLILSILLDVPYYANLHIRGLPFSLSTPHAVATLQVHGSLRGVNRIRPINFPPISSGTLGTHDMALTILTKMHVGFKT